MTTLSLSAVRTTVLPFVAMTLMGLAVIGAAGMAQSSTLHDAAHDSRHAIGFPCH